MQLRLARAGALLVTSRCSQNETCSDALPGQGHYTFLAVVHKTKRAVTPRTGGGITSFQQLLTKSNVQFRLAGVAASARLIL